MQHIATLLRGADCHRRPFWAKSIFALDRRLQRRGGVFEYSDKSDCIFRVQLSRLPSDVLLSDGTFGHVGDRVIDLHFWNEQIPVPPTRHGFEAIRDPIMPSTWERVRQFGENILF